MAFIRRNHSRAERTLRLVRPQPPWSEPRQPVMLRFLADQAQHAIERADAKASTLAATATAVLAILLQDGSGGRSRAGGLLFLAAAPFWIAGIVLLGFVVFPRFRRRRGGSGHPVSFVDLPDRFDLEQMRALARTIEEDGESVLLMQAHSLSRIAMVKYRLVRGGMLLLAAGLGLGAVGAVLR